MNDERYLCVAKESVLAYGQAQGQCRRFSRSLRATETEFLVDRILYLVRPTWRNIPSCSVGQRARIFDTTITRPTPAMARPLVTMLAHKRRESLVGLLL